MFCLTKEPWCGCHFSAVCGTQRVRCLLACPRSILNVAVSFCPSGEASAVPRRQMVYFLVEKSVLPQYGALCHEDLEKELLLDDY